MTPVAMSALSRCFQGLLPSIVATCAADGTPNVTFLSQVFSVDDRHVALSCQFFNKTRRNVGENPWAFVELIDPLTLEAYRLTVRYVESRTSGPLYDAMALRIQAIASVTGMEGVFRLLSADVCEVVSIEQVAGFVRPSDSDGPVPGAPEHIPFAQLRGVQLVSQQINRARDLADLLETVLVALDETFGFRHAMILLPDETGKRLYTIASRGFGAEGVGAEVVVGQGIIGAVAAQKRPLRVSGVDAELRYGRAIRERAQSAAGEAFAPEIPLPGLPDCRSQLAMPLLVQDRLVGVLALQSRDAMVWGECDEAFIEILANQIAIGIDKHAVREDEEPATLPARKPASVAAPATRTRTFTFFRNDDCVFVDDEYLIRNVPGKILWKLLTAFARDRRAEFSNRELRLDPTLGLPAIKDNLESRLILLRKRLEQQCPDVRIVPVRRGRFALDVGCSLQLVEKDCA